ITLASSTQPAGDPASSTQPAGDLASSTQPAGDLAGDLASSTQPAGDLASTPQPAGDLASSTQPAGDLASSSQPSGDLASSTQPAGDPASTLQGVEAAMDPAVPPFSGSTKVEQDIRKAWDGMIAAVLLSKIGPYKLFYFDIFRTAPGRELKSEVKHIVFLTIPNLEMSLHWMGILIII
ncbi:hypothetical protein AMECASPLE_038801, partial [Ameca splendens]